MEPVHAQSANAGVSCIDSTPLQSFLLRVHMRMRGKDFVAFPLYELEVKHSARNALPLRAQLAAAAAHGSENKRKKPNVEGQAAESSIEVEPVPDSALDDGDLIALSEELLEETDPGF